MKHFRGRNQAGGVSVGFLRRRHGAQLYHQTANAHLAHPRKIANRSSIRAWRRRHAPMGRLRRDRRQSDELAIFTSERATIESRKTRAMKQVVPPYAALYRSCLPTVSPSSRARCATPAYCNHLVHPEEIVEQAWEEVSPE